MNHLFQMTLILCRNFFQDYPSEIFLDNHQITPEQCSSFKIKIEELGHEIKHLSEYENAIIVFENILSSPSCKK